MDLRGSWGYINHIARSRLAHNKTNHHVSDYGEGIELIGAAGEICARRFLGLKEVLHNGFDDGVDIEFCGKKIDVKATQMTPQMGFRFMQWPVNKNVKSDIILMTAVDPINQQATVIGYATKAEIEGAPVNFKRDYPCKEISIRKLHPAWELQESAMRNTEAYKEAING